MWTRTWTCCHRHPRRPGEGSHRSLLQPAFPAPGTFRLWNTRRRQTKGQGCPGGVCGGHQPARVPREIPGTDGVRRVVCQDPAEDTGVLRQMRRLLLDEEPGRPQGPGDPGDSVPSAASASSETRAQGAEPAARKAGPLRGGAAGGAETEAEAAGSQGGRQAERGGRPTDARRESDASDASAQGSLGVVLRGRSRATREPADGDAADGPPRPHGEPGDEGLEHPEFVAIVASTDPSDPSAREELQKIAAVMEVEDAGRVDAVALREATRDGSLRESSAPWPRPAALRSRGERAPRGLPRAGRTARGTSWSSWPAGRAGGPGRRPPRREGGGARGGLGEVLALLAAGGRAGGAARGAGARAAGVQGGGRGGRRPLPVGLGRTRSGRRGEAAAEGPSLRTRAPTTRRPRPGKRRGAGGRRGPRLGVRPGQEGWRGGGSPGAARGARSRADAPGRCPPSCAGAAITALTAGPPAPVKSPHRRLAEIARG
ncbi:paraneoplastic antigen-like protein 8B [Canis lupus familiaris]|uniref:paraneoplastic antigen-like protein 8B n=1 Tax=Canis lupus familiaris TaxID=9615 RepID=UPI0018F76486|nr:paraneoplastic antigen-like protein 8B [Canis lupus familiaris]